MIGVCVCVPCARGLGPRGPGRTGSPSCPRQRWMWALLFDELSVSTFDPVLRMSVRVALVFKDNHSNLTVIVTELLFFPVELMLIRGISHCFGSLRG